VTRGTSLERILRVQGLLERKASLELALVRQRAERLTEEADARVAAASLAAARATTASAISAFSTTSIMARRDVELSVADTLQCDILKFRIQEDILRARIEAEADRNERNSQVLGLLEFIQHRDRFHSGASHTEDDEAR
jgi:hypothetical protein